MIYFMKLPVQFSSSVRTDRTCFFGAEFVKLVKTVDWKRSIARAYIFLPLCNQLWSVYQLSRVSICTHRARTTPAKMTMSKRIEEIKEGLLKLTGRIWQLEEENGDKGDIIQNLNRQIEILQMKVLNEEEDSNMENIKELHEKMEKVQQRAEITKSHKKFRICDGKRKGTRK